MPTCNLKSPRIAAVVPAAGHGSRMGSPLAKQYLPLAGQLMIEHSLNALLQNPSLEQVVVALSADDAHFQQLAVARDPRIATVVGGAERANSVLAALEKLALEGIDWVLVHDAARPCLTAQDLNALMEHCLESGMGGLLAAPVRDTMKRAQADSLRAVISQVEIPQVETTIPREQLWHALTPQMFPLAALHAAYRAALAAGVNLTDEASAMEWAGHPVALVSGSRWNIKVTTAEDLPLAAWLLSQTAKEL